MLSPVSCGVYFLAKLAGLFGNSSFWQNISMIKPLKVNDTRLDDKEAALIVSHIEISSSHSNSLHVESVCGRLVFSPVPEFFGWGNGVIPKEIPLN